MGLAHDAPAQQEISQVPEVLESGQQSGPTSSEQNRQSTLDFSNGPKSNWIWGEDPTKQYTLTKEFNTEIVRKTFCKFTCDNQVKLFINNKPVGESTDWEQPITKDITSFLKPGKNVIRAEVSNEGSTAGFALKLVHDIDSEKKSFLVTDSSWMVSERGSQKGVEKPKVLGKMGDGPWGDVFANGSLAGGNQNFQLPPGFQIERLFSVPKDTHGSWVCICTDDKGRIIASDQDNKGLFRITPGKPGTKEPSKVEKLKVNMTSAQGLLYAFGSLYVCANGGPGSGLYRLRDTNGDDQFDEIIKLKELQGGGEHGPHALRLSPDGKGILVSCGNHTLPPKGFQKSRIPSNWNEDHILPRQWDANGHAMGILAPGGYIARTDPEGKEWEILSIGYRNQYDFGINPEGELFVYDADMEWDFGMPWYRPTRVNHATSGSELGWRSGTGKWPAYYPDSLPAMIDIGPGSPVGVEFGTGAKFPAKYQKALFICDWTFGTMYALHLTPKGSSYSAIKEEFVSRAPLPLTDVVIGKDGAMYFTVGGRGTQSELYRITYIGDLPTHAVDTNNREEMSEKRDLRKKLESFHGNSGAPQTEVDWIVSQLGSEDRFIRYAARIALEHQPVPKWQDSIFKINDSLARIQGIIALTHQAEKALKRKTLNSALDLDYLSMNEMTRLEYLRAIQLIFIRMGAPNQEESDIALAKLDSTFPGKSDFENRELINVLVYLQSPSIATKTAKLLVAPSKANRDDSLDPLLARNRGYGGTISQVMANRPDSQKIHYLFALRNLKDYGALENRKAFFSALNEARTKSGGASYQGFLNNIEKEAYENAKDTDRLAIEALGLRKPVKIATLPKPVGPGKPWSLGELEALTKKGFQGRSFENGKKSFSSARCIVCHRFNGEGGATGPDLSQVAGRFGAKDLSESIIDPNKVVSDQYRASVIETHSGKLITGKIVSETATGIVILTDPEDSTKVQEIKKTDLAEIKSSPVSLMPAKLIDSLNQDEVLDLLAYMLSKGDSKSSYFSK